MVLWPESVYYVVAQNLVCCLLSLNLSAARVIKFSTYKASKFFPLPYGYLRFINPDYRLIRTTSPKLIWINEISLYLIKGAIPVCNVLEWSIERRFGSL